MQNYSEPAEISAFLDSLGPNPMLIFDMDGNIVNGYTLVNGKTLPLAAGENPAIQSIPYGSSPDQITQWVEQGVLHRGIFAEKPMDARLPKVMVGALNDLVASNQPFKLAFLTSRSLADALTILRESGLDNADMVTLVADSGASVRVNGEQKTLYTLSDDSAAHLGKVDSLLLDIREAIQEEAAKLGLGAVNCPDPVIEHKGFATNFHYRELLKHFEEKEGSAFDQAVSERLKDILETHASNGPNEKNGLKVFSVLDGPATVEFKVDAVNKGMGLEELAEQAVASNANLSSVVFSGDDIAKKGFRGTDYFGMIRGAALETRFGIPFYNIHTHHPVNNDLYGTKPDPLKDPAEMTLFDIPVVHVKVATPTALLGIVLSVLKLEKEAEPALKKPEAGVDQPAPVFTP